MLSDVEQEEPRTSPPVPGVLHCDAPVDRSGRVQSGGLRADGLEGFVDADVHAARELATAGGYAWDVVRDDPFVLGRKFLVQARIVRARLERLGWMPPEDAIVQGGRASDRETFAESRAARVGLTPRESEVLALIARGLSNKEVARRLETSVRTVETHRLNLRRKLKSGRKSSLYESALRLGLLGEAGGEK